MSISNLSYPNNNVIYAGTIYPNTIGDELSGTVNIAGALAITNGLTYRIRKSGNWVDLYIRSVTSATAPGGTAATIASFIPAGYRPIVASRFIGAIQSNGTDVAGRYIINTDGSMSVGQLSDGFFAAGTGQIYSFSCTYTIT